MERVLDTVRSKNSVLPDIRTLGQPGSEPIELRTNNPSVQPLGRSFKKDD